MAKSTENKQEVSQDFDLNSVNATQLAEHVALNAAAGQITFIYGPPVKGVVTWIVRSKGDKIALADTFGSAEYPLGIMSGMIRLLLVCLFTLALLNSRLYTTTELASTAKYQQDNFGSISLPTIGTFQKSVFQEFA